MVEADSGIVIYDVASGEYYTGHQGFDKQLRKAKIYHKQKFADQCIADIEKKQNRTLRCARVRMSLETTE